MDKFATKPADKGPKNYIVRSLAFCPDSSQPKLAVAQSDNIVFIYKWTATPGTPGGGPWDGKKSICNKFAGTSPVTSLIWPNNHPFEVVYGLAEGKVKIGQLRSNKHQTLYAAESYVVALAGDPGGTGIVSAHLDGAIYRYNFPESNLQGPAYTKIATHSCVPYALAWGRSICAAGNDRTVCFYDRDGGRERAFDYSGRDGEDGKPAFKEFTAAAFNSTGDSVVVGNFDSFSTFSYNPKTSGWDENEVKTVENMYSVTALAWKSNGSTLAVGTLCGLLDVYDACIRRYTYKKIFEMTYVSPSQVLVKNKRTKAQAVVKSKRGNEVLKIVIHADPDTKVDRYVVAKTEGELILMDLETEKASEIQWHGDGETEKVSSECFPSFFYISSTLLPLSSFRFILRRPRFSPYFFPHFLHFLSPLLCLSPFLFLSLSFSLSFSLSLSFSFSLSLLLLSLSFSFSFPFLVCFSFFSLFVIPLFFLSFLSSSSTLTTRA